MRIHTDAASNLSMNLCINPECSNRNNSDNVDVCQSCGNSLLINHRYRLIQQLSDNYNTCTEVFEVVDTQNQATRKILKCIYNNRMQLPDGREFFADLVRLFQREQWILINLEHSGIPRGEDYFSLFLNNGQELHCLVMEKIEGQNLEEWLNEHGALNQRQALRWLKELATILDFIHQQNWFHRDIKPSNIMRRPNGQLVLIDFGTVRQITGTVVSGGSRTEIWSHGYTPPEQIDGRALLQSDFYALGRTFVHLLTGKHPCDRQLDITNWRERTRYRISDSLVNLINRLMASDYRRRHKNAKVILRRLALIRLEYKIKRLLPRVWVSMRRALRRFWLSGRRALRRFWLRAGLILAGLVGVLIYNYVNPPVNPPPPTACNIQIGDYLSCGEEILVYESNNSPQEKQEGITQFAAGQYSTAVSFLEEAWEKQPDPETLIYLNNAKINLGLEKKTIPANKVYTIAVAAPLKFTPDSETSSQGLELLRGVAQAQDEALKGGFNLKVLIANDANQDNQAREIAQKLVSEPDILGVVGHFSSDRTTVTLPIYEQNQLVLVSPTSTSVKLNNKFFFRTVPSDKIAGKRLAQYLLQEVPQEKVAVFGSPKSAFSNSLMSSFTDYFNTTKQVVNKINTSGNVVKPGDLFDLSSKNFDASIALDTAKNQGATAIVLVPDAGTTPNALNNALEVIKSNNNPDTVVVGGDSLYIKRVLEKEVAEKAVSRRLVVAMAWHRLSSPNPEFPESVRQLWGTKDVSWRTATAYDAARVLIEAIKQQKQPPTRAGVQQVLSQNKVSVTGSATGEIKFDGSDRANPTIALVKVVPFCSPKSGYYFVPIDYRENCFQPSFE